MKVVTQGFKDAIRTFGRELDTIVTIGEQTFDKESLNGITPTFNSGLFCTIMKGVEIDLNVFIPKNSIVNVKSGVLVNDAYEYINYGNYKTKDDSQIDEDTSSFKVIAYDKILESMVDYDLGINYPISVRDYWVAIFNELSWDISGIPETFRNSTKTINQDVHSGIGYTYRDVLDELCMISGVWLVDKNGIPTIVEPNKTGENIDETYLSDVNVTIKQKVFFNSLVFARAEESDNIYRKDDASIAENGLHEFRISDNQLLSTNDRDLYIDELWEYLKTFNYYAFEVDTIGIMFLEPLDAFNIVVGANTYPTILLNDETQITQGLKEVLYSDEPEESQTDYKYADTTDRKLNQTYILVDKQKQTIEAVVSQVEDNTEHLTRIDQNINEVSITVSETQKNVESQQDDISNLNSNIANTNNELNNIKNDVQNTNDLVNDMKYTFTTDELKIQSSNDPVNSAFDNQGVRVYNYTTLKSVLNDKGSGFDDLIVTNTAQIAYLKFVKAVDENNEPVSDIHHLVSNIQDVEDLLGDDTSEYRTMV